jgi:hypothetical protein
MKWLAATSLLALAGVGPAEPPLAEVERCTVHGLEAQVLAGSLLVDHGTDRLALVPGQALACTQPAAALVLVRLEQALSDLPIEAFTRPLRIHLDPRLPPRQAPLGGVEVHVSSREILITSAALPELPAAAWRHELLHVLAAAPPELGAGSRKLWLSLEEGVVMHLDRAQGTPSQTERLRAERSRAEPTARAPSAPLGDTPAPPYWALALASPSYDPHPLAAELARSLRVLEPEPELSAWLSCLSRPAPLGPAAAATGAGLAASFGERCPARAAALLSAAIGLETRGVPPAWQRSNGEQAPGAGPHPNIGLDAGKAAARAAESL